MLEQCDFMELTEEVLQQCRGFTCKDEDITEFFTHDYADYAYQLLGKSYCFVKPDTSEIVCAFTVANSSVKVDSLPSVRQLAVSDLFSGQHIGDELLDFIKSWFIDPLNKTGCRYVIVDAVNHPKVFDYYQRNGFKFLFSSDEEEWVFLHNKGQEPTTPVEPMRTRLMYFDLIYLRTK